jgi:hypothetical protein
MTPRYVFYRDPAQPLDPQKSGYHLSRSVIALTAIDAIRQPTRKNRGLIGQF